MDFNNEKEPLLSKDYFPLEINEISIKGEQKSYKQILDKSCSYSDIFENLFFCCINYDLTKRQYDLYIDFRNKLSVPYNHEDVNHENILQDFFNNLKEIFSDEEKDIIENLNDSNTISTNINNEINDNNFNKQLAKKIGFQNNNPRSDFRAGGLSSLEFMNYFIIHHKVELKEILKEKYFNFALTCINLSFLIRLSLYLTHIINIDATLKSYHLKGFTRKQIKNFAEHLLKESKSEKDFLFSLISQCLIFIFKTYQNRLKYEKNEESFVKINLLIKEAIFYFGETLNFTNKDENLEEKLRFKLAKELIDKAHKIKFN